MLKAIETRYKGYRFRSRLEARWAVFFDKLGLAWEYEREGYDLGSVGWYLPDFWLPRTEAWAEVKPEQFTLAELKKCEALCHATKKRCYLLAGLPNFAAYDALEWSGNKVETISWLFPSSMNKNRFWGMPSDYDIADLHNCPGYVDAVVAARSARFEHGERP